MALDPYQVGYFITQVGLSAASFGVAADDVTAVGMALANLFGHRCAPPTTVVPAQGAQLQAICVADTCPLSPEAANCSAYEAATQPAIANATLAGGQGATATSSAKATVTSNTSVTGTTMPTTRVVTATGSAAKVAESIAAAGLALLAYVL